MNAKRFFGIAALLLGVILLLLVSLNFTSFPSFAKNASAALSLPAQAAAPTAGDSEIGSTDGILAMGIVIVLIIVLPLIFQKRR